MHLFGYLDRRIAGVALLFSVLVLVACGSDGDLDATIDARVEAALAAQATVTPQPTASPQPSPTPVVIPTQLPTATPVPTATPQPTTTPFSAPTRVPTVTPQPTSTPAPTATPFSFSDTGSTTLVNDLYSEVRLSVVKIRAGNSFGSGWAIENGWIITNEHVVVGRSTVTVEIPRPSGGIRSMTGTVRGVDTKRDLAAIEVDHGAPVLPTRIVTASDAGTPIMQLGYSVVSSGGFPVVHTGVITTVVRHFGNVIESAVQRADEGDDPEGVGIVFFDADADPGDSGGPVMDLDGNVVAVTFGAQTETGSGKRVIGKQQGTAIESVNRVWEQLKEGTNTSGVE